MNILDTTLRDGSYALHFKFTTDDVRDIVARLNRIGVPYIEIGHGLGLNASSPSHGLAMHTDEEYIKAASESITTAKLGVFCIPGIARKQDIVASAQNQIHFIRIGVTVQEYDKAVPYITYAVEAGLTVFCNFMKTYTATPAQLAKLAKDAYNRGALCAYIVDSTGSMFVEDIQRFIHAIRSESAIAIGFHGHNNLGLAVQNALFCAKNSVEFVDCSLQGLGRSLGNTSLEQFVMALELSGMSSGFDIPRVLEYGYAALKDIIRQKLTNPLDYVCGFAAFHSGYIKDIYRVCNEKKVDPLRLIIAYAAKNTLTMDLELLRTTADELPKDPDVNPYSFREYFSEIYGEEQ